MEASPASSSHNSYSHNINNSSSTSSSPRSSPPSVYSYRYNYRQHLSPSPPPRPEPLNLRTRQLQLRNARFQGATISPAKVSGRFSTWRSSSPSSDTSVDKENQPASPVEQQQKTPGSVRRRVSILQEIHDSSQRGRKLRRSSVTRLFGPPLEDVELSSTRRHAYRSPSILADGRAEPVMATSSAYQNRSSPLSSLDVPSHKNRLRSNSRDRATSYATERYIEHLETQLAAAQNQLSPMQVSTATQAQTSKLRSLSAELKVLRQEISEWEDKFEVRVHEEIALRMDIESKLRTKIIFLEGQLEDYTTRVKELECERDLQAQKLRNVESLRSTNRGLERRIDVLTELLAQSPTKLEPRSPEVSPTRSPGPRLSRPKSMLPSVPLRTDLVYQSLADPSVANGDAEAAVEKQQQQQPEPDKIQTPDLIPDDSTVASSAASKSQRSSTISHPPSTSTSSRWSVPLPFSPELQGKTPGRSRNMRRFPSGTCSLKPLILPTTATPTPASPQRQSLSAELHPFIYSPNSERGMSDGASAAAQEETLAVLEGRAGRYHTFNEPMSDPEEEEEAAEYNNDNMSESPLSRRTRSVSEVHHHRFSSTLFSELEEAERNNDLSTISQGCHSRRTTNPSTPMGLYHLKSHGSRSSSYSTTNPKGTKSLSNKSVPVVFHGLKTSFGTFTQTLIAGIWQKSIGRLGKLPWWILGILLGPQQRDDWLKGSSLKMKPGHWTTSSSSVCYACGQSSLRHSKPRPGFGDTKDTSTSCMSSFFEDNDTLGHTLLMWTKFSVAIIVAFGRAIRYGPASVLLGAEYDRADEDYRRRTSLIKTSVFGHDGADGNDFIPSEDVEYTAWTRPRTAEDFFTS
ncbi:hypothetical protein UA08_05435 [Talaromyces atroroseus]|uniref:Uncharacterized protein n=1 Tax=Talaromyces atroroseus TaxID=1441469 RepID=A0A225B0J0_TALAT|nr:hypothetical protein UA08_05435 [Talaromyces atroroseus]OKL59297.1 hypothetical protein UA08_05435 [Talaromyces atroroseus]